MNSIVEDIAPSKTLQRRAKDDGKYPDEIKEMKAESDIQLEKAIESADNEEYRVYNNKRNKFQREVAKYEENKFKEKVKNPRMLWREVHKNLQKDSTEVPTSVIHQGKLVTSPKKLSVIFNDFFVEKIQLIRDSFTPTSCDPIKILELLVP